MNSFKNSIKKVVVLLCGVFFIAVFVDAGFSQTSQQSKPAVIAQQSAEKQKLTKLPILQSVDSLVNAPMYVAYSMGYFKNEGYEVEFTTMTAGTVWATIERGSKVTRMVPCK